MGVTEIGRRSFGSLTNEVLGTGVMFAVFQVAGASCCVREKFTRLATTCPSSTAHVLYSQKGISSGPVDLDLILPKTDINSSALNGQNSTDSPSSNVRS